VNIDKKLVSQFAGVLAVAMLFGTSAFAEDRHHDGTNNRGERREVHQRESGQPQVRSGEVRSNEFRNNNRTEHNRQYNNDNNNHQNNNNNNLWRGSNERRDYRNNNNNNRYNNDHRNDHRYNNNDRYRGNNRNYGSRGTPYRTHGRISRIDRWNGGYRVWIGGGLYPFFVPEVYFRSHRWSVGIDIGLGGYYNSAGYYDYYDEPYYDGSVGSVSSGALRGVVETVDFRRGTFVIRDDISGNFVTVVMRGRDYDFGRLRAGDYVDVAGDWSRNGLFEAYRADLLDYRR